MALLATATAAAAVGPLAPRSAAAEELQPLPPPPASPPPPQQQPLPLAPPPPYAPGAAPAPAPPAPPTAPAETPRGPPPPPPGPPPTTVRFEPDEPDVTLLRMSDSMPVERVSRYDYERWYSLYSPVCDGPCTTHLAPGAYRLALAKGGRIVPARGPVVVDGPATLRAEYIDRTALRTTGLVIGVAGTIGGFIMVVASAQNGAVCDVNGICVSRGMTNVPLLAVGVSVLVASAVVGSILTFQHDGARITVEPLVLPTQGTREGAASALASLASLGAAQPQGGAVALHF